MPEKKDGPGGPARGTARRRRRLGGRSGDSRVSRPLMVAMIVILAGAAYLFWPRGGGAPTGIGEQHTVVTADSSLTAAPRSGNVEIQEQRQDIVPEEPSGASREAAREPEPEPEPAPATPPPASQAQTTPPRQQAQPQRTQPQEEASTPTKPRISPRPRGAWAVQVGAFEAEANAQKLVEELAGKQVQAHVRAAGTSSGAIVYRVWIGWFASRQEAQDYARQESKTIGESYPVHR